VPEGESEPSPWVPGAGEPFRNPIGGAQNTLHRRALETGSPWDRARWELQRGRGFYYFVAAGLLIGGLLLLRLGGTGVLLAAAAFSSALVVALLVLWANSGKAGKRYY
jgi:hypothetical protein